jgi:CRISPR-associated protein Csx14
MPQPAILVATLGAEAQVVTLMLDALLQNGEAIQRVYVVHTDAAQEPIHSALKRLQDVFSIQRQYPSVQFLPHLLVGRHAALSDLISTEEIESAYSALYQLLRQQKLSGYRVHLCLAGGRKTMTVFAFAAAQVTLSAEDRVWHLVSSESLLQSKSMHSQHPDDAQLIPVPFISLSQLDHSDPNKASQFLNSLTVAERELTELLITRGLSNADLADELGKSPKTIANQLTSVYLKLKDHYLLESTPDRTLLMALIGRYS